MATRRQRIRPRPRWSNAVSLVAAAAACACVCPCAEGFAPVAAARVLSETIQEEDVANVPDRRHRRLEEPLEGVDAVAILREIGQVDCPETVSATIRTFLDVNKPVVEACTKETGYTLYPYGTKLPDADQTSEICRSPNCMDLLTGVVLAKLPECEYQRYSPRSFAESFLRVRADLLRNRRPPTAAEFGQLYALNRVVNYLTENTTIQASVKTDFKASDVAARLNPVELNTDVVLSNEFVVMVNKTLSASSGSVHAAGDATATKAPTVVIPSTGSNSDQLTNAAGNTKGDALPENLQTAYLYTGLLWFFINVLYYWVMIRKGSTE